VHQPDITEWIGLKTDIGDVLKSTVTPLRAILINNLWQRCLLFKGYYRLRLTTLLIFIFPRHSLISVVRILDRSISGGLSSVVV